MPATVDAYIAGFPADVRERLEAIRATIRRAAPQAEEKIAYQMAAYHQDGALVYFAGFDRHIGFYPAGSISSAEFAAAAAPYRSGKGTLRFPHDAPLPLELIEGIVRYRVEENAAKKR